MRMKSVAPLVGAVLFPGIVAAQGVDVVGMEPDPATLAEALALAPEGSEIVVSGVHVGTFTIDRPLVLRGSGEAVLDGGGAGTVLTIRADGVTVEGLTLNGSGLSEDYWQSWGAAGLHVEADGAVLASLTVTGNAWGVLFRGGAGSVLRGSLVADNQRDGVTIMGGTDHEIAGNRIDGNRTGIVVDSLYGENDRVLLPLMHDPAWSQEVGRLQAASIPALRHRLLDNMLTGNGATGILLHYHVRETQVLGNGVSRTGIDRAPDAAEAAFWEAQIGAATFAPVDLSGSGILLFCWPEANVVAENEVVDNLGVGIGLEQVGTGNVVRRNLVRDNAVGIDLAGVPESLVSDNDVTGNADYGIVVDLWLWMGQGRSGGNLILRNDLTENGINAFDGSGRLLTAEEIAGQLPLMPWPEEMRQVYANPAIALQMAQMMVGTQVAGINRWDDGQHGNRHDDFDVPEEGFGDRDGDGIGEVARAIPGGTAEDGRPLTAEALVVARDLAGQ